MALLCLGLFLALALCGAWQAFAWGRTQLDTGALVCADTLRLHIRAESDSIASQSAKLHVRDAVLAYLDTACPAQSKPEAITWAAQHLFELQLTARHALAELNIRTPVQVQLVNMYFDTRRYASGILPAGRYDALRIQIGAGNGRNWWCVVFPPLCLGSVSETTQETALEAGLTENQVSLMTGEDEGYVVKFKAVELLEQFKGWLEGR